MALRRTGVELVVKNFDDYIRKLEQIQKTEKQVFSLPQSTQARDPFTQQAKGAQALERELKNLQRAEVNQRKFEEQAAKARQRELANELKVLQRNERERTKIEEQAAREAQRAQRAQGGGAGGAFGAAIGQAAGGLLTLQGLQKGFQLTEQAAAFQAQQAGFENLAKAYGTSSAAIVAAMQRAANGVLSSADIIQAANKALLLGVAQTPQQFEEITRTAIALGRAMGLDATEAIDQFTTALGRKSLLILDNFGISSKQVNAEMERLAQVNFGKTLSQLDQMQRDSLFTEAALSIANQAAENLGEGSGKAAESFERLSATSENLALATGTAFSDVGAFIADRLTAAATTAGQLFAFVGAGIAGIGDLIQQLEENAGRLNSAIAENGLIEGLKQAFTDPDLIDFDIFRAADEAAEKFKETASAMGVTFGDTTEATATNSEALQDNTDEVKKNIEARQKLARQAENIDLNFRRAQEDAARKLARSQEKLAEDQAKARAKLLEKQAKEFDKLQADSGKELEKLQADTAKREEKLRKDAATKQLEEQRRLQLQLRQAEEQFNLDRLQARRRFAIADEDLRAEGDILGLRRLRRDFALEQTEAQENFDLQEKQTKDSVALQQLEQARQLEEQLQNLRDSFEEQRAELTIGLEDRRAELLASFDEELVQLNASQAEQRAELQRSYQEQLEDLRLNRARQLEDLGRSFVEQEGITKEGAQKIADELEAAFGEEGIADVIMSGFAERQASAFQQLFADIAADLDEVNDLPPPPDNAPTDIRRRYPILAREHGGPVAPGQPYLVGEAGPELFSPASAGSITPTMQTMRMLAGTGSSSSSRSALQLSGGFHVSGSGSITDAQIEMISERVNRDVVENYRIALQRRKGRR